jgi:hypothetical protein
MVEKRPGWVPSIRRGRGVHTTGPRSPIVPCRFSATSPLRQTHNPSPTVCVTTHTKIHSRLPVRSFPARNPRMDQESLGISVGFTPSSYPDRMPQREERLDTRPATASTPSILHPLQPLVPRDITSHSRSTPDALIGAPFPCAHHEPPLTDAAHGGLKPPPAGRLRRANQPPSLIQHRYQQGHAISIPTPPSTFVFTSSTPTTGTSSLLRGVPPSWSTSALPVLCDSRISHLSVSR